MTVMEAAPKTPKRRRRPKPPGQKLFPCTNCGGPKDHVEGARFCLVCRAHAEALKLCRECGAVRPKRASKYCAACAPQRHKPCRGCGDHGPKLYGSHYCADCAELARWRSETKKRANNVLLRRPCRVCGRPKMPGRGETYCATCRREKDALALLCTRCGERPRPSRRMRLCSVCKAEAERLAAERCRSANRRWRERVAAGVVPAPPSDAGSRLRHGPSGPTAEPMVPVAALEAAITRQVAREKVRDRMAGRHDEAGAVARTCARLFENEVAGERAYRAWRSGERTQTRISTVDPLLMRAGWHWWDVWNEDTVPDPETLERVRRAFEGKRKRVAA